MRRLELLSPARDSEVGRKAILAGADAVYIGAPGFGARAAATNSITDIAGLTAFAHRFRAKVYVTMNTILFDNELNEAEKMVHELYKAGVDALIVQDMAYLEMDLPPISLHASTQCDIRTPEKAAWLAKAGFSQLVLPREFTLAEISNAREAAGVPVEVFVHGALCVSYSGDCQAGCVAMGRSANRGVCPQMCRLPYELVDSEGRTIAPRKHYLSLRDLNRSQDLTALVEAGADSFKIEGRLKDARYVANVTAAYSRILDKIVAESDGKYERSSCGTTRTGFRPDLDRTFNRNYTSYFIRRPSKMASVDTPKWGGRPIGTATSAYDPKRRCFRARLSEEAANGDGFGFFDSKGEFVGFRVNKVDGINIYPATPLPSLRPGTQLYRNGDRRFLEAIDSKDSCQRSIKVNFELRNLPDSRICITAKDERGCSATVNFESPTDEARSPQESHRASILSKLGDTDYTIGTVDDRLGTRFVPASILTNARRDVIAMLDAQAEATYSYDRRHPDTLEADSLSEMTLDYHGNVANKLAEHFYLSHGATIAQHAIEVKPPSKNKEVQVMSTKYCLRRELGACLKENGTTKLPSPLFLRNESGTYRLDFDCRRCGMNIFRIPK